MAQLLPRVQATTNSWWDFAKISQLVSLHQPLPHHFALHITARIFSSKCISPLPKVFSGSPSPLSRGQVLLIPTGLYMIGPLLCFRLDLIHQRDTPIPPLAPTTLASVYLRHSGYTPTSGPLHLLFFLFADIWSAFHIFQVITQCHLLRGPLSFQFPITDTVLSLHCFIFFF